MTKLTRTIALGFTVLVASGSVAIAGGAVNLGGIGGMGIPDPFHLADGSGGTGSSTGSGNPGFRGGQAGDIDSVPHAGAHKLACIVGGSPANLPNGILVTNTTRATLLAGTRLNFVVPAVAIKGSFLLPSNVPAGTQLKIAELFAGAPAGSPCTVKIG